MSGQENKRYVKVDGREQRKISLLKRFSQSQSNLLQAKKITVQDKHFKNTKELSGKYGKATRFPATRKITRKERLNKIRIRLLLLKYISIWQRKTFGRISPSKARKHYQVKLLQRCFCQWEDVWWSGKNEWKLNIRAEYHNRFRLWLKTWRRWRSYIALKRRKKAKTMVAKQKADHSRVVMALASWKQYIRKRKDKRDCYIESQQDGIILLERMAFNKWKNQFNLRQALYRLERNALGFCARCLLAKSWRCWMLQYSMITEENLKTQFASKCYHRRLTAHTLEHLKLYVTQRREEKARFDSGIRFHRSHKLRLYFLRWKITWERNIELMQFKDKLITMELKARKRRTFLHWKHYIILCCNKQLNISKSCRHFQTRLKRTCLKILCKRVVIRKRKNILHVSAMKHRRKYLQKAFLLLWLRRYELREDLRHVSLINFVQNFYRKIVLRKMLKSWKLYRQQKRGERNLKLIADVNARRHLLPRYFNRWEIFVDKMKKRHFNAERGEEFRRECLLAKTFYRWLQEHRLQMDVQTLRRIAILSHMERLTKKFFLVWSTRTRETLRENSLLEQADSNFTIRLKSKCFEVWRNYVETVKRCSQRMCVAIQHQNRKITFLCWTNWRTFVVKKRDKWRLLMRSDFHYRRTVLKKILEIWKLYCKHWREVKTLVEGKKQIKDVKTVGLLFERWRENARYFKLGKENHHMSVQHWTKKCFEKIFTAWRIYAFKHSRKKLEQFNKISAVQKKLERGYRHRVLVAWKRQHLLKLSSKKKSEKAEEYWKRRVLERCLDVFKKKRFQAYRKQALHQHCMVFHNERIVASHWKFWHIKFRERVQFVKMSHMALWLWSFTLQRKTFVSWIIYTKEKKRKKAAVNQALERRRAYLHKVTVIQWIKFATFFISKREQFAASRHVQFSENIQRIVQKCAIHWRRVTIKHRDERPRSLQSSSYVVQKRPSTSVVGNNSTATDRIINWRQSQGSEMVYLRRVKRLPPRIPQYLIESDNLTESSEHVIGEESESVPRNFPSNIHPISQPSLHEPSPLSSTSSCTVESCPSQHPIGLNTRASGRNIFVPMKNYKTVSSKKPLLLPPSSFMPYKSIVKGHEERDKTFHDDRQAQRNSCSDENNANSYILPSFISMKENQETIVILRNRMLTYYTLTTHLRESQNKLTALRHRTHCVDNGEEPGEEKVLVNKIISELTEQVDFMMDNLKKAFQIIANDLDQLLQTIS
ncbi:protein SFI1 homolog isoform X2 [Xenia sp. Carnegie-2017]|uniref:protein SFI1 homolog isoform X2 n=1 Tax=Xenia sp. Carnegie-2017 TaxID=2897299 RepID=UPI001F03356C|nr:protein SFI1 homolog isoform X2 [Xenia sp. Carnegie-2017]